MEQLIEWTTKINAQAWGPWMIALLLGTGIWLTIRTRFFQIRKFLFALGLVRKGALRRDQSEKDVGDISPFQALTTALAATVGNGNIAGVATAIYWGGPGAPLWMWISALFGMSTKYAEGLLSVRYRRVAEDGTMAGGPMYYMEDGLSNKKLGRTLGLIFGIGGSFAALFGTGNMMQSNSLALALNSQFHIPFWFTGVAITALVALVIIGGIKRIGAVAERLVPTMVVLYIVGALFVIFYNYNLIPHAVVLVFKSAFSGQAAIGGFIGAGVREAVRRGVSKGLLSNEAGLGSAAIAHGAARAKDPIRQGSIAMMGTFIDTILVCSMTALVIIVSGQWSSGLDSTALTVSAFNTAIPFGGGIVALGSLLFGFTTLIGWYYYGEQCLEYLFGLKITKGYRIVYVTLTFIGSILQAENLIIVWNIGETSLVFMAIPNLIGILLLSGVVAKMTEGYFKKGKDKAAT